MRGHEEASGTKYVPQDLMDQWAIKDPVENYRKFFKENKILTEEFDESLRTEIKSVIDESLAMNAEPEIEASLSEELNDIQTICI
jgi:2-oxoisovalerate dehydrogenase E1 component